MTLGDELRAVLNQEADMQIVTEPDVDRLIVGGRARRRRRNVTRAGSVALAVVLIGGGAYAATQDRSDTGGSGVVDQPTVTPEPVEAGGPPTLAADPGPDDLEPGTYRIPVSAGSTIDLIEADLTLEGPGWRSGDYPVVEDHESLGGVGVYRPTALAARSGCQDDLVSTYLGERPLALARELAKLPRSTVVQPVAPTDLLGREAVHLQLRISQECERTLYYRVAETPRGSRGITYPRPDHTFPPVVIDFWVIEVDGVRIVVDTWHQEGASADLVDRVKQARDSITLVTAAD